MQQLADETGLEISVCHFPPGTSKWSKIERRLLLSISQDWRGKPLISHCGGGKNGKVRTCSERNV